MHARNIMMEMRDTQERYCFVAPRTPTDETSFWPLIILMAQAYLKIGEIENSKTIEQTKQKLHEYDNAMLVVKSRIFDLEKSIEKNPYKANFRFKVNTQNSGVPIIGCPRNNYK